MKRWKPKNGEKYWMVNEIANAQEVVWWDDKFDRGFYEIGNCFKTAAEAVAAAEKFKALLLSLQDNGETLQDNGETLQDSIHDKELPKLTAEVFNRPGCPKWANWVGLAPNGCLVFFRKYPDLDNMPALESSCLKNSLIERPAVLPEWCKVGEWVFADPEKVFGPAGYKKIKATDGLGLTFADGCCIYFSDKIKQARLRPYNADEMRELVGKVIENSGRAALVLSYIKDLNKIHTEDRSLNSGDLCFGYTLNGKPCGKFEHLNDNGEWKE